MTLLVEEHFEVRVHPDGSIQLHESVKTNGSPWGSVFKSFKLMQEDLIRQTIERRHCPMRAKHSYGWGRPKESGTIFEIVYEIHQEELGSFNLSTRVKSHTPDWRASYRAMLMIRAEVDRQIRERFNCPFHPAVVKRQGLPVWED